MTIASVRDGVRGFSLQASGQVHTLVQDGVDEGCPPARVYVENVVVPVTHDLHMRITVQQSRLSCDANVLDTTGITRKSDPHTWGTR